MKTIDNIAASSDQSFSIGLDDGSRVDVELMYRATAQRWSANITWGDFTANGVGVSLGVNLLRSFMRVIPFGFMVTSDDSVDPIYEDDFFKGRVSFVLLSADDISYIEENLVKA